MDPQPSAPKAANRNRFSLILQLASSTRTALGSPTGIDRERPSPTNTTIQASPPPTPSTRTPLLSSLTAFMKTPTSPPPPQDIKNLPPTSNELAAKERTRLVKKARKLSRVFGEVAVLDAPNREQTASHVEASQPTIASPSQPEKPNSSLSELPSQPIIALPTTMSDNCEPSSLEGSIASSSSTASHRPSLSVCTTARSLLSIDERSIDSVTPTTPIPPTAEQLRKARLAKLTRHLGENIPPELVSKPCRDDASISTYSSRRSANRRRSLDVSSLRQPLLDHNNSCEDKSVKRSRSLWTRRDRHLEDIDPEPALDYQAMYRDGGHMNDRQRVLNVKRARKMTQLFGHEPPVELIQILNDVDERLLTPTDDNRDSIAAPLHIDPDLTSTPTLTRYRSNSIPSPVIETPTDDLHPQIAIAFDNKHPITPPPFSDAIDIAPTPIATTDTPNFNCAIDTFQERRRRAAKLSRFFGVGFQDLTPSLVTPDVPGLPDSTNHRPTVAVDVKMSGPGRFWGFADGRRNLKEADMVDVIDKLRGMKAS